MTNHYYLFICPAVLKTVLPLSVFYVLVVKSCISHLPFSAIKTRPKEGMMYFEVLAIVDPVTKAAQRLAPLLLVCPH